MCDRLSVLTSQNLLLRPTAFPEKAHHATPSLPLRILLLSHLNPVPRLGKLTLSQRKGKPISLGTSNPALELGPLASSRNSRESLGVEVGRRTLPDTFQVHGTVAKVAKVRMPEDKPNPSLGCRLPTSRLAMAFCKRAMVWQPENSRCDSSYSDFSPEPFGLLSSGPCQSLSLNPFSSHPSGLKVFKSQACTVRPRHSSTPQFRCGLRLVHLVTNVYDVVIREVGSLRHSFRACTALCDNITT